MKEINKNDFKDLDEKKIKYFKKYFTSYYNEFFIEGQGTEEICEMLLKFSKGGRWLDVGAGPCTLFWALMLNSITEIDCSEISKEGLFVLDFLEF